ncbi:hypothetical protein [Glaciecola sp. KUL10]|uniref:hypothetical protein n=1 Tax=Glaciecola sp. (strain KUL10) TaxID=2161813 RepID=UPI000D78BB2F|nr:hypothetical protein [Glaciecola sp. KUL10]GBL06309.1 DTDP-glucose pyrophosphorylase [Glaciecola sp. KUL10]
MTKIITLILVLFLSGCINTPAFVKYNGKNVATYSIAAGCGTLMLQEDCSQISGATRKVRISGINLKIAGGEEGKLVFIMAMAKFSADESTLIPGAKAIEEYLLEKNISVTETKVMYADGRTYGVHLTLDGDGYSHLKELTVE